MLSRKIRAGRRRPCRDVYARDRHRSDRVRRARRKTRLGAPRHRAGGTPHGGGQLVRRLPDAQFQTEVP